MNIDKKALGARIKQIRKTHGLTLESFGKVIDNASKSNVSKWEKGLVIPNNFRLKLIAEKGNMSIEDLTTGSMHNFLLMNFKNLLTEDNKKFLNILSVAFINELSKELTNKNVSLSNIEDIKYHLNDSIPSFVDNKMKIIDSDIKYINNNNEYFEQLILSFEGTSYNAEFLKEFLKGIMNLSTNEKITYSSLIEDLKNVIHLLENKKFVYQETSAYLISETNFIKSFATLEFNQFSQLESEYVYYKSNIEFVQTNLKHYNFLIDMEISSKGSVLSKGSNTLIFYYPDMNFDFLEKHFKNSVISLIFNSKFLIGTLNSDMIFNPLFDSIDNEIKIKDFSNCKNIFPVAALFF